VRDYVVVVGYQALPGQPGFGQRGAQEGHERVATGRIAGAVLDEVFPDDGSEAFTSPAANCSKAWRTTAVAVDHRWNVLLANGPFEGLVEECALPRPLKRADEMTARHCRGLDG
jgi:hypothetical protein